MPDGVLPPAPFGSLPLTDTRMLSLVVVEGRAPTVLVGGVVSISHEVARDPTPEFPARSCKPDALTVSV